MLRMNTTFLFIGVFGGLLCLMEFYFSQCLTIGGVVVGTAILLLLLLFYTAHDAKYFIPLKRLASRQHYFFLSESFCVVFPHLCKSYYTLNVLCQSFVLIPSLSVCRRCVWVRDFEHATIHLIRSTHEICQKDTKATECMTMRKSTNKN